jgi:NADH-quinone oxidoreductase subunit H
MGEDPAGSSEKEMNIFEYLGLFLIFPGFLFTAFMGLMVGWVDRKVTARIQYRVGPPWYQNFLDIAKLFFVKETLLPAGVSKTLFLGMPALGLAAATLVSTMVLVINAAPKTGFVGDLIVVVYLLLIPPISIMLGGFVSENSLASLGASREMKLMMSYELPFLLAMSVPIIKCGYAIKLGDIIMAQNVNGPVFGSASGIIAFFVMLICIQAKLGLVPFDIPEAETEIMAGPFIEYSGKALGFFKLQKAMLGFIIPVIMITLFFGGIKSDFAGLLKNVAEFGGILVLMIVIKNTNPRVRIDQAIGFFWKPVTAAAVIAVGLAYFGK